MTNLGAKPSVGINLMCEERRGMGVRHPYSLVGSRMYAASGGGLIAFLTF